MSTKKESISAVLITQGKHKFYTCTMFSDLLAKCAYVVSREDDPKSGFQRYLNKKRAEEIAEYVDSGFGTIPSSIVVSAQEDSDFEYDSKAKTLSFKIMPHAFLILDGQHRVYGFSLAEKKLRVPVVIYEGLSREEEVTIFIDLNTKQKPVPNELLLDIKKLANAENDQEKYLNDLFDIFSSEKRSCLKGLTSPFKKEKGMVSRVTFKTSFSPVYPKISHLQISKVFEVLNSYLAAFDEKLVMQGIQNGLGNPTTLGGVMLLFPEVFQRARDRKAGDISKDAFLEIIDPIFNELSQSTFRKPGNSKKDFYQRMTNALKNNVNIDL